MISTGYRQSSPASPLLGAICASSSVLPCTSSILTVHSMVHRLWQPMELLAIPLEQSFRCSPSRCTHDWALDGRRACWASSAWACCRSHGSFTSLGRESGRRVITTRSSFKDGPASREINISSSTFPRGRFRAQPQLAFDSIQTARFTHEINSLLRTNALPAAKDTEKLLLDNSPFHSIESLETYLVPIEYIVHRGKYYMCLHQMFRFTSPSFVPRTSGA